MRNIKWFKNIDLTTDDITNKYRKILLVVHTPACIVRPGVKFHIFIFWCLSHIINIYS